MQAPGLELILYTAEQLLLLLHTLNSLTSFLYNKHCTGYTIKRRQGLNMLIFSTSRLGIVFGFIYDDVYWHKVHICRGAYINTNYKLEYTEYLDPDPEKICPNFGSGSETFQAIMCITKFIL